MAQAGCPRARLPPPPLGAALLATDEEAARDAEQQLSYATQRSAAAVARAARPGPPSQERGHVSGAAGAGKAARGGDDRSNRNWRRFLAVKWRGQSVAASTVQRQWKRHIRQAAAATDAPPRRRLRAPAAHRAADARRGAQQPSRPSASRRVGSPSRRVCARWR